MTDDQINQKLKEMYLSGMGIPQIAKHFCRSQCFVGYRLKKMGVQLRRPGNPDAKRPYRATSADLLDIAVKRYLSGESARSIADNLCISKPTILGELRDRGIEIRLQARGDDAAIVAAYLSGWSVNRIEKEMGCTKRRASNVLKSHGVTFRKRTIEKTPASRAAACKRRSQRISVATPPWADTKAISEIYAESRRLSRVTGKKHHVDHFYPLSSELVCGLHTPANLVIVTERENVAKKNKIDPKFLEWVYVR